MPKNKKNRGAIGRCCICNKKVFEKQLISGAVVYMKGWPGDGFACVDHTGVHECYAIGKEKRNVRKKMPDV